VRVTSDKQTLILAGEAIPRRAAVDAPLTIVATRADDTMLLAQGDFARKQTGGESLAGLIPAPTDGRGKLARYEQFGFSRGASFSAAHEYARTQDLAGNGAARTAIIDTYA
jgi:hypothetical protein